MLGQWFYTRFKIQNLKLFSQLFHNMEVEVEAESVVETDLEMFSELKMPIEGHNNVCSNFFRKDGLPPSQDGICLEKICSLNFEAQIYFFYSCSDLVW